jgi:hypothetical protein
MVGACCENKSLTLSSETEREKEERTWVPQYLSRICHNDPKISHAVLFPTDFITSQ